MLLQMPLRVLSLPGFECIFTAAKPAIDRSGCQFLGPRIDSATKDARMRLWTDKVVNDKNSYVHKQWSCSRNVLSSAGKGFTISDSIMKNHLLFHVIPSSVSVSVANKADGLIANMDSTWESLVAERVVKVSPAVLPTLAIPTSTPSSSLPTPTSSVPASLPSPSPLDPLTFAQKEALPAAKGCYHCRKTPESPGWVKHHSDSCPGDAALGILPCSSPTVVAAVDPVGFSSTYEESYGVLTAVIPSHESDDNDFSSGTDDNNLSTRNY
ncbi:hypothetical protein C8R43DRAFT_959611 [Mycena crocata]|nr:hypothetical protein C8R43DRAFT_959611 [Mycena crocata]